MLGHLLSGPDLIHDNNNKLTFENVRQHQEAVAAKDALQATHLYGRHLVIEWAKADDPAAAAAAGQA